MNNFCLGLKILGSCSYDPASPAWRIISLGDTIAAIALVLTFSQLLTNTLKQRINTIFPIVYALWATAVVFIFISSILPIMPGKALPLLGYPIFWEIFGAGLLIISIVTLLWSFNRRLKFSRKTVSEIRTLVTRVIATGEDKDYIELAILLRKTIKDLITYIKPYHSFEREMARRENRSFTPPPLSIEAGEILQICSDQAFCSAIIRKEPAFAITLFEEIKKQNAYNNNYAKPLVWEIVRQSLLNTDSILHREKNFTGLGLMSEFTTSAFSDGNFNEKILPLSRFRLILEEISLETLNLYGEILCQLAKTYIKEDRFYELSFSINSTFNNLVDYAGFISSRVDLSPPDDLYNSITFKSLNSISRTLKQTITIFENEKNITNNELVNYYKGVDRKNDFSPFQYIANWIYEFIKALSHTEKHDREFRSLLIDPWMEIYPVTEETIFHSEVQWRLEEKLFKQLKVNLEEGYYPAVTKPLIWVLGLQQESIQPGETRLRKNFLDYLSEKFPMLYQQDSERALDKLPIGVTYDLESKSLIQFVRKGDERTLKLKDIREQE